MARFIALTCALLVLFIWLGCGGNVSSTSNPTPAPISPSSSPPTPTSQPTPSPAVSATFVYVANNGSEQHVGGSISGFRIDPGTGNLSALSGSPFAAGDGPSAIATDPQGHFVFVAEDQSAPGARGSNCTLFHSTLLVEKVDSASGTLTRTDRKTLDGVCARAVAVDPSSTHVYVAMGRFSDSKGEIQGFAVSGNGTLTELPGSPYLLTGVPTDVAMHASGKFLYVASDGGLLVVDRNTSTGLVVERGAFNTPKRNLALNPAGTFLAASEMNTNEISEFHVDPNTGDIAATDIRAQATNPFGVAADPLGKFFATTEMMDSSTLASGVSMFVLSDSTHELEKSSGSPFPSGHGTGAVAFDATGMYLYAVNRQDGTVSGFAVDRTSGSLKPVPGVPFAVGDFPDSLVVVKPH